MLVDGGFPVLCLVFIHLNYSDGVVAILFWGFVRHSLDCTCEAPGDWCV